MYIVFDEDYPSITKGKEYEILSVEETFNSNAEKTTSYYTILKDNGVEFTFSSEDNINYRIMETENIDNVTSPSHYNQGDIETIDFINQTVQSYNSKASYHAGNVIKYIARAPHKNGKEDLKKAKVYLNWLIESVEE